MSVVRAVLAVVAAGVVVSACGGSGGSADGADGSASSLPSSLPSSIDPSPTPVLPGLGVLVGIPERGVEAGCIVMDGYLLMGGDRDLLLSGRELWITGGVEKVMTTCQQGTPFRVDAVTPEEAVTPEDAVTPVDP